MLPHVSYPMSSAQKVIASECCAGVWVVPLPTLETDIVLDLAEDFSGGNV